MKVAILASLLAVALATPHSHRPRTVPTDIWEKEGIVGRVHQRTFSPGHQFDFLYDAQVLTGVPGSSRQHAATRIQSRVKVQFKTETSLLVAMDHIQFAELNRKVPNPREVIPIEAFNQVTIQPELLTILQLPIELTYRYGMISEIKFSREDSTWSMNIKRAVLSLLQVKLENKNVISRRQEQIELQSSQLPVPHVESDFYIVEEPTLEGLCNTSYTVTRQPCHSCELNQPVLNITKSINFEECNLRPQINYNFRFASVCPECGEKKYEDTEKFLESSTIYRYNISGTPSNFLIESAVVESQYIFTPYNEQSNVIVAYTNQSLILVKTRSVSRQIPTPSPIHDSPISKSIIYSPRWDALKEKFFMTEDEEFLKKSPFPNPSSSKKIAMIETQLNQLIHRLNNGEESHIKQDSPRHLARLVKVLRIATSSEIERALKKIFNKYQDNIIGKDMFVDSLGLCSTKACLKVLINNIKNKEINPTKGGLALKSLISARAVGREMIDELLPLCSAPISVENPTLRQSCYLVIGSMMGSLCRESEDYLAREYMFDFERIMVNGESKKPYTKLLCPRDVQEEMTNKLFEPYTSAETTYSKILILKAMSNAGLPPMLPKLEQIIRNGQIKPLIRTQAIDALRQMVTINPVSIQRVLMPIYLNQREIPEVRMSALHQIMQTLPPRPILDQIARSLVEERSNNVAAFTITYMTSMANSTNPCEKRVADDLKVSLRHSEPLPETLLPFLSSYHHTDLYSPKYRVGAGLDTGYIFSNISSIPKELAVSLHKNLWGQWRRYLITLGIAQQDLDQLMVNLMGIDGSLLEVPIQQLLEQARVSGTTEPAQLLKMIYNKLAMRERSLHESSQPLDPTTILYLRLFNQEIAVLPISKDTMPEMIKNLISSSGKLNLESLLEIITKGYNFEYYTATFIREMSRKIPTSLGLPLVFNVKAPTIMTIRNGHVKVNMPSMKKINALVKATPNIASSAVLKLSVWSPIVNTGVMAVISARAHLPIHVVSDIEYSPQIKLKTRIILPKQSYKTTLLTVISKPMTFIRVWPSELSQWVEPKVRTIVGEEWNRVRMFNNRMLHSSTGVGLHLRGQIHRTPLNSLPGTPWTVLAGPNKLEIIASEGEQPAKEIELTIVTNLLKELKQKLTPTKLHKFYRGQTEQEFFSEESFETSSSEEIEPLDEEESEEVPFENYLKTFKTNGGIRNTVKVTLRTKGPGRPRIISALVDLTCGDQMRHCKAKLSAMRTPIPGIDEHNKKVQLLIEGDMLYPSIPYTFEDLTEDKKVIVNVLVKYGVERALKKIVELKIQGERSIEQQDLLENSQFHKYYRQKKMRQNFRSVFSPISQYDQLIKASTLTQFRVVAKYNKNEIIQVWPNMLNTTYSGYRLFKYLNYWSTEVNQLNPENPQNQIRAQINLDPMSFQLVNITAELPTETVRMTDLPLPSPVHPMNIRRPRFINPIRPITPYLPRCIVGTSRITTFDQVVYRAPLTTCYSVISKDCSSSEQPRFAVLVKKLDEEKESKKVKIITENTIVTIKPTCETCNEPSFEVKVNKAIKEIPEREPLTIEQVIISRMGPYLRVEIVPENVRVFFDGFAVSVKVPPVYMQRLCGLCGHYDNEPSNEFLSSNMESRHHRSTFFKSFLHKEECSVSQKVESELEQESAYEPRPFDWEREQFDDQVNDDMPWLEETSLESQEGQASLSTEERDDTPFSGETDEPLTSIKMIETSEYVCFSNVRLPHCPTYMYPDQTRKTSKKVRYHCVERSEPQVELWQREVLRQRPVPMDEIERLAIDEEIIQPRHEIVPKLCRVL